MSGLGRRLLNGTSGPFDDITYLFYFSLIIGILDNLRSFLYHALQVFYCVTYPSVHSSFKRSTSWRWLGRGHLNPRHNRRRRWCTLDIVLKRYSVKFWCDRGLKVIRSRSEAVGAGTDIVARARSYSCSILLEVYNRESFLRLIRL